MTTDKKGLILRIEKTSIHDGQGLRTVVFFKGCPLKCEWCSTPESHNMFIEKGYMHNKCTSCGTCVKLCPEKALCLDSSGKIVISKEKCQMNLACYDKCPHSAYKKYGTYMTVDEVIREISKDEIFYFHSGGGVTFSGGEPFMQPGFLAEIIKACKLRGIHTAMETSLYSPYSNIEKALSYLDVLYVDIKHMDSNTHVKYTGVKNELILKNIMKVDASPHPVKIHVRVPLIPTINDSHDNLLSTLDFCKGIKKLQGIELLPYHRLGIETYKHLVLKYKLWDIAVPAIDKIKELAEFMSYKSQGIKIKIGSGLL